MPVVKGAEEASDAHPAALAGRNLHRLLEFNAPVAWTDCGRVWSADVHTEAGGGREAPRCEGCLSVQSIKIFRQTVERGGLGGAGVPRRRRTGCR